MFMISRGAELDAHVVDADLDGKDPLPEYLQTAQVHFRAEEEQLNDGEVVASGQGRTYHKIEFARRTHRT